MNDGLNEKIDMMKREIDSLQIEIIKEKTPWYKTPATIISALALIFSFGTTTVSFYQAKREEIHIARSELRGILQRINILPKENFEIIKKFQNDPAGQQLAALVTQENSLLARQAQEIVDRFPDEISATEYLSLVFALMNASATENLHRYLDIAIAKTSDPNTKVTLFRSYGAHLIRTGQDSEGSKKFEQALSIWRDYPNVSNYFKASSDALTEMYWARTELEVNNIERAKEHIRKAVSYAQSLSKGEQTDLLKKQIASVQEQIEKGTIANTQPGIVIKASP